MKKKKPAAPADEKPKVHPDLEGFEMSINSFGEIVSTHSIDKLNEFLNRKVDDKKLRDRDDLAPPAAEA
ncbi:MAG: hypothetical protein MUC97_01385 [Bernardetiaceae bacterium]|jgi:hypothetical protein|nr:hypothetical protein [Bernardetiaceae bacterium]